MLRKGWFRIAGIQDGDRTLNQQLRGLAPALQEARGKTVADLGCAEGLIALEFAKAGAGSVHAWDVVPGHIAEAKRQATQLPAEVGRTCRFYLQDLHALIEEPPAQYDVVLALAIIHKLRDPERALRFCAAAAGSLLVIRLPSHGADGVIRSKYMRHRECTPGKLLPQLGFRSEQVLDGPGGELVQYWRRA